MEPIHSASGFTSEASLPGNIPHTPPYTPHRAKRRLERSDSPASTKSIHPAETSSPAKKAAKRFTTDDVKVEELTEGDAGYMTDLDVVYPHELEEVESDSSTDLGGSENDESDSGITTGLSRLNCDDSPEAEFEKKRRDKHLRKRTNSRVYKRSHSQSVKSDTETTDPDAMADHDLSASARRLRRRMRGPMDDNRVFDDVPRSSAGSTRLASAAEVRERWDDGHESESSAQRQVGDDAMDIDDAK